MICSVELYYSRKLNCSKLLVLYDFHREGKILHFRLHLLQYRHWGDSLNPESWKWSSLRCWRSLLRKKSEFRRITKEWNIFSYDATLANSSDCHWSLSTVSKTYLLTTRAFLDLLVIFLRLVVQSSAEYWREISFHLQKSCYFPIFVRNPRNLLPKFDI